MIIVLFQENLVIGRNTQMISFVFSFHFILILFYINLCVEAIIHRLKHPLCRVHACVCHHVLARGGAMGAGGTGGGLIGPAGIGPSIAIEPTEPAGKGPGGIVPGAACKFDAITDSACPNNGAIWMDPGVCAMYVLIEVKMVRTCILLHCLHVFLLPFEWNL